MMHNVFVYILQCVNGVYYTGHTDNLEKRLSEHQHGLVNYTSGKLPVKLVYSEKFDTRNDAFHAERKLKSWTRY